MPDTTAAVTRDTLIQTANTAYYTTGDTILTDREFDLLADTGLDLDPRNFRRKVSHSYPMGSLSKVKNVEALRRWMADQPEAKLYVVMPKYDGNAIAQSYPGRDLARSATRGDGEVGNDVSANMLHTQTLRTLPAGLSGLELRVEAIIPKRHSADFEKNIRNVASGRINAKDPEPAVLGLIQTIVLDVVAPGFTTWRQKKELFSRLPQQHRPPYAEITTTDPDLLFDLLQTFFEKFSAEDFPYKIDGLVVEAMVDEDTPLPPPSLDPTHKVAVKFDEAGVPGTIGRIEVNLGLHAKLCPVLILDPPVEIDGTTVTRITASNYALLQAMRLGVGAQATVFKAGDIIPEIGEVLVGSDVGLELPLCPACGTNSQWNTTGVDAVCPNPECEGGEIVRMQKFVALLGIDFVSDTTIENLYRYGIDTLEKLFAATIEDLARLPGFGVKSSTHLVNSLAAAQLSEAQVIKATWLKGVGVRKSAMLLDHYGTLDALLRQARQSGLDNIPNFGPIQTALVEQNLDKIESTRSRIETLGIRILPHQPPVRVAETQYVCATGACPGFTRAELSSLLAKHGYIMEDRVSKNCQLLICADPGGKSDKLTAARKKGITIQSYGEFLTRLGATP